MALWAIPLGLAIGALGTLIGAGGGFVLMPMLLMLYPEQNPEVLTSIALAVVFLNATSGSWAYARRRRIDYRSGLLFSAATIPGAVIGAMTTAFIPRQIFNGIFGVLLVLVSVILMVRPVTQREPQTRRTFFTMHQRIVEADGTVHTYTYDTRIGVILSLGVGYLSSLLGIGGGILHVPILVRLLGFPIHIATATSHFVLAVMALAGTGVHLASGVLTQSMPLTFFLGAGVVLGAQVGAAWSDRMRGVWILRGLALVLALVGVRILFMAF